MKKTIFALIGIFLVAGCIGGGGEPLPTSEPKTEYGYGLKVIRFEPDYDEIYSDDIFGLNLEVQNLGDSATQESIVVELTRYGDFGIMDENWEPGGSPRHQTGTQLNPPDIEYGVPGEARMFSWNLKAPQRSSTTRYEFGAKIRFGYKSVGSRDYLILSRDRMVERNSQNIESGVAQSSSTGPVLAKLSAQPDKVILDASGSRSFPVKIEIQDVGSGLVLKEDCEAPDCKCSRSIGCVDEVVLKLQATPGDGEEIFKSIDCTHPFTVNDGETEFGADEPASFGEDVTLMEGSSFYIFHFPDVQLVDKRAIVSCFVRAEVDVDNKPYFESNYLVNAEAVYTYQIESSAEATILGEGV